MVDTLLIVNLNQRLTLLNIIQHYHFLLSDCVYLGIVKYIANFNAKWKHTGKNMTKIYSDILFDSTRVPLLWYSHQTWPVPKNLHNRI